MNKLVISKTFHGYDDIIDYVGQSSVQYTGVWFSHIIVDDETLIYLKCKYKVLPSPQQRHDGIIE